MCQAVEEARSAKLPALQYIGTVQTHLSRGMPRLEQEANIYCESRRMHISWMSGYNLPAGESGDQLLSPSCTVYMQCAIPVGLKALGKLDLPKATLLDPKHPLTCSCSMHVHDSGRDKR